MHPVFLQIGNFTIAWYGVLITLGIVIGAVIGTRMARQRGLNEQLFSDLILWSVVWGVIGARLFFVATSWNLFAGKSGLPLLLDIINIRQGGISIHGGLIFGVAYLVWAARRHRINFYRYADLFVPGVCFGIIGGRIGNIMNGSDTVGRVTGWPVGFHWPAWARGFHDSMCNPATPLNLVQYCQNIGGQQVMTAPVHFTQLYGVIIGIILSVLAFVWLRSPRPGWVFWQFWLWYSILRAGWEETFRLNPLLIKSYLNEGLNAPGIGLWTETQLFSIPLILLSIYMLWRLRQQPEQVKSTAQAPL
ncbi:prolipoprotein diacylglyceryl transferase [Deinococcus sonorensis]|uniref:Phosphatidylglycerol--prolipoprotein diacylglyceryl transferase n=2 Tax=Deinococcus sonorensis TaxID=309891 RepID=A0AAU7U804_9DEIO